MYKCILTPEFLSDQEKELFSTHLNSLQLDHHIWDVLLCLFKSGDKYNQPLFLKVYRNEDLIGAAVIIRCSRYGKSLFNNRLLSTAIDLLRIPFYLWIKFGCCMDMMSNPGFVKDPENAEEVHKAMIRYLNKNKILTIVNDYSENASLYKHASVLPALPHALINTSSMTSIHDYTGNYKNIKRKIRVFEKKGGEYNIYRNRLEDEHLAPQKNCFLSTSRNSVFYLPYQDLYLNAAMNTSKTNLEGVYYFVATLDGEFIGYQAAIKTGDRLNALHGAFDRNRKSTFHAYDLLFVKMTEFAIENGLKTIDFGAVINFTKQKMINQSIDMSYFLLSKYIAIKKIFNIFLKLSKIQGKEQLRFRGKSAE
jgi:hypothetical protein